ncbi:hypothetical protein Scep_029952 [Stephania cephalantha]|uniref:Uncharacterized protein n=1 Tax=Stephania cephalantha TaxID=152367 RepID=A0AAP0DYW2_9MAGN
MSLAQYDAQFSYLLRFAGESRMTKKKKMRKYMYGLQEELVTTISATKPNTLWEVRDRARAYVTTHNFQCESQRYHGVMESGQSSGTKGKKMYPS